jgi:hypothetical protein
MRVNGSGKHSSLLRYGNNDGRKPFTVQFLGHSNIYEYYVSLPMWRSIQCLALWVGSWGQCYKTFHPRNLQIFVLSLSIFRQSWKSFSGRNALAYYKIWKIMEKKFYNIGPWPYQ